MAPDNPNSLNNCLEHSLLSSPGAEHLYFVFVYPIYLHKPLVRTDSYLSSPSNANSSNRKMDRPANPVGEGSV